MKPEVVRGVLESYVRAWASNDKALLLSLFAARLRVVRSGRHAAVQGPRRCRAASGTLRTRTRRA